MPNSLAREGTFRCTPAPPLGVSCSVPAIILRQVNARSQLPAREPYWTIFRSVPLEPGKVRRHERIAFTRAELRDPVDQGNAAQDPHQRGIARNGIFHGGRFDWNVSTSTSLRATVDDAYTRAVLRNSPAGPSSRTPPSVPLPSARTRHLRYTDNSIQYGSLDLFRFAPYIGSYRERSLAPGRELAVTCSRRCRGGITRDWTLPL